MLREKLTVNHVTLNNRIVMPPMATAKSSPDGKITEDLIAYYKERAIAGTGLIITEHSYICDQGKASPNQVSVSRDSDVEGLKKLADAVHACSDTKIIVQINHAGSGAKPDDPEMRIVSSSPVPKPRRKDAPVPEELTEEEIAVIVRQFAEAARRVKEAGFDGVEIHSAHGYLLNQFYSPITNQRNDAYGGSLENRMRIHKEVLHAVREAVGNDFLICVRLGGIDYMEGGSTLSDACEASKLLEAYGADMISLSGGLTGYINPDDHTPGYFREMSKAVKNSVNIPVLLTGGVTSGFDAEKLLKEGDADLIGIGRAMLIDPAWSANALHETDLFEEVTYRDADFNVFKTVREDWLILTAGENPMTCSWGHMGCVWGKTSLWIYVRPDRYTKQFMDEKGYFSVCIFNEAQRENLKYVGTQSGRNEDKVKHTGWTAVKDEHGIQYYDEAEYVFLCRKIYHQDFVPEGFDAQEIMNKVYANAPMHTGYVGEILRILKKK